jgi:putative spermidine/putrescine transport system ATP-binding protein
VRKVPQAARMERVRQALAMVRLERFADRRPAQLSGGQQQRVALARALVFAPRLVLLDEPLGALDKKLREQMQIEIKHLHEDLGVTMIFVTHDQDEALTMSDRVAVFDDGVIQQIDTPMALYERPVNSFVATFLGDTNLLHGEVAAIEGEFCRVRLDGGGEIIQALRVHPAPPGGRVSLAVRPERVTLATAPSADAVAARVIEVIYHGAYVRIVLDAFGAKDFRALLRAGNPAAAVEPGTQVHVSFAPRDCRALDPKTA